MTAIISDCGLYRYRLDRKLSDDHGPTVAFIMVNPSTADATQDDPTIRKCIGFAKLYHAERLVVGNKFAYRATDVKELRKAADPIGPENDKHLHDILYDADLVFVAWGSLAKLPENLRTRWHAVVRIADSIRLTGACDLLALGKCGDGHPRHPLMTGYDTPGLKWPVPWFRHRQSPQATTGDRQDG